LITRKRNVPVEVRAALGRPPEPADRPVQQQRTTAFGKMGGKGKGNRGADACTQQERMFDLEMVEQRPGVARHKRP
jgi:hypothetical protein